MQDNGSKLSLTPEAFMTPAMEMLYGNIKPNFVYTNKRYLPLPRQAEGERQGHGCAVFFLCPSQEDTVNEIKRDYLRWYLDQYKWYTTDTYFREKIGKKWVIRNMRQEIRKDWDKQSFPHMLRYLTPQMRSSKLAEKPNLLIDLGQWTRFYFQYSFKTSIPVVVKNFITFLGNKLNDPQWAGYTTKLIYIPINLWFTDNQNPLGFTRRMLNNPLAIIMYTAYRYPELLQQLPQDMTVILGDSTKDQFLKYQMSDFTKRNFPKIKMRLKQMKGLKWDEESETNLDVEFTEEEEDETSELNNSRDLERYDDPLGVAEPKGTRLMPEVQKDVDAQLPADIEKNRDDLRKANRAAIINEMKRSLMGDTPAEPKPLDTNKIGGSYGRPVLKKEMPAAAEVKPNAKAEPKKPTPIVPMDRVQAERRESVMPNPEAIATRPTGTNSDTRVGKPVTNRSRSSVDDITAEPSIYEEDELTELVKVPLHLDDEDLDELVTETTDEALLELLEEDNDALLNDKDQIDLDKIEQKVQQKLKTSFLPQRTEAQERRIDDLRGKQDAVLPQRTTAKELKSKIVETSNFSNAIATSNPAIRESKFVNFDRDYNRKKLQSDIDGAVKALSGAQAGIYVVGKEEQDISTQLDLKKLVTYHLEDEFGGKHTIKLEIPVIVDDKYIYINGSRLLLGHQQIMMPLVKATKDTVQVVTWYNKLILIREGVNDTRTSAVKRYMEQHRDQFSIELGNAMAKNMASGFASTLDIDMYAKYFIRFNVHAKRFILDRAALIDRVSKLYPNLPIPENTRKKIPVGYDTDKKDYIYVTDDKTLTDLILERLAPNERASISAATRASERKLLRSRIKIMTHIVPLALLLMFYEGFETVMRKAEINYTVQDKDADLSGLDRSRYDILELADKYIVWERNPIWNTLLMNGLSEVDLSIYDFDELEDKDTFANLLTNYFTTKAHTTTLMQYYDFMISDPATQEILRDMNLPTDFVTLLLLGNKMLCDNSYTPINDAHSFRVRSNEIIAEYVYAKITDAYGEYRKSLNRLGQGKKPKPLNVRPDCVISAIVKDSSLTNEASVLNPILELEKARSITPRGPRGIGKPRAMTLQRRAYSPSMLGILGMTTSPDYKVGVNRQMTLEPNVTSTRGYVQVTEDSDIDSLSNANLLTPAELLSPPGALHDDGPRTGMAYKQSQYMLPVDGSQPVFFGNKVESAVPYHMSREFVVAAQQDGEVVEIKDGIVVVQYKDGTYDSIDTNLKMKNNSSSGFYISNHMETELKEVGQKFKKNEIIGYDPRAFSKNDDDIGASMNIGVPIKVAILPNYDIYEDAGPITKKLSDKFTAYMAMKESVGIPAQSFVQSMVNVGDQVKVDDPLIVYDPAHEDEETNAFLAEIREKLGEDYTNMIDLKSMPQVRTEYAGRVSAIEVYTSVPVEELSESLQKIVKKYTKHSANVVKTLDKYKNPGDMNYYKCGQVITNAPDVVKADYQGRVKGVQIGNDGRGVVIFFYVEFKDIAKTGDKGSAFTALKFITSHVVPEGFEAYSEYRPDEEISTVIAPGAVLARKTPSIQVTMFANKLIVEMKRHACQMFFEDTDPRAKHDENYTI